MSNATSPSLSKRLESTVQGPNVTVHYTNESFEFGVKMQFV